MSPPNLLKFLLKRKYPITVHENLKMSMSMSMETEENKL